MTVAIINGKMFYWGDNMDFLYDYQLRAVEQMKNGCILNGGTGSGKSRTALYYYFVKICGGEIQTTYKKMKKLQIE